MEPTAHYAPARRRPDPAQRRPRTIDPRLIARIAFVLAVVAMALVIVYAVGWFVEQTVQAVPTI